MVTPYGELDNALGVRRCSKPVRLRVCDLSAWPDLRYITHCNGLDRPVQLPVPHVASSGLRRLLPVSAMRWELCTRRSRMASASVGSPTISYQRSTGTWLVMVSEPPLER